LRRPRQSQALYQARALMAAGVTAAAVAAAVAAEVAEVPAKVQALAAMARAEAGWAWAANIKANMGLVVQAATRAESEVAAAQRSARGTQGGPAHP
jgi:hypothetical protein